MSETKERTMAMSMNLADKVARHRLSVLELAQALGNVSVACRQRGMTRTQFYDYKRRFELQGLEGLKDLPPIHKTHPQTTSPEVVERIPGAEPGASGLGLRAAL
jgi:Helix-turn-helix domain